MQDIKAMLEAQRKYFASNKTFDIRFRTENLKKLKKAIKDNEAEIANAIKKDLGKSQTEAYMCEIGLCLGEIQYMIDHIKAYTKPHRRRTPLASFHASSFTVAEPYGCVLIMSPWNYPFMLCIEPLAGAIAAGNCCILKPSAYSPETSRVIKTIIESNFPKEYIAVVEGGRNENAELLEQRFDYIFFTGGVNVGKLVMEKAAAHLTPVTLELGGKSPCIVEKSCNIKLAAKRIAFGKYLNCGQTCIAPDYILIDRSIKKEFIDEFISCIKAMYTQAPLEARDYGKMINKKHFDRVLGLIDEKKVIYGGGYDESKLKIEPTVMDNVTELDAVMGEEIFGPVMPIIAYDEISYAEEFIRSREKPLALYLFSNDRDVQKRFIKYISFGGGCINDTIMHIATSQMGFGGVGNSGMGAYHGRKSFETFSHEKSIQKKYNWIDLPLRYQPYNGIYDKLIRLFLR